MNQVLPSKTHRVDSKQDYGPKVRTNLTLKGSSYRVVNLIFYALGVLGSALEVIGPVPEVSQPGG